MRHVTNGGTLQWVFIILSRGAEVQPRGIKKKQFGDSGDSGDSTGRTYWKYLKMQPFEKLKVLWCENGIINGDTRMILGKRMSMIKKRSGLFTARYSRRDLIFFFWLTISSAAHSSIRNESCALEFGEAEGLPRPKQSTETEGFTDRNLRASFTIPREREQ